VTSDIGAGDRYHNSLDTLPNYEKEAFGN
jgi:hypothetical protein